MADSNKTSALIGSTRLNLALIGFLGCMIIYTLRTDVSFAIVCMVNNTQTESDANAHINDSQKSSCNIDRQQNSAEQQLTGELLWSKEMQGMVLSAFFWGYICSQIFGGYMAVLYGGRLTIGVIVLISSVITLLSPLAANTNVYVFAGARALLGFVQGGTFPAFHTMWSMWAPPLERSLLVGVTYAGAQVGNTLVMPLSGLLCKHGFAGGWPSIFYILGIFGLIWSFLWLYYVSDRPSRNKRISSQELTFIEKSLSDVIGGKSDEEKRKVPWLSIMTSVPVWALFCGHFAGDWGAYIMMTSLPLFMNDVLGLDFTSLGFLSAIPYIVYFVFINIGGMCADKLRNANLLSTIGTRRLAMIIALGSQAIFLVASGYCHCGQQTLVIIFLTLGIGLSGIQYAGFVVNYLDVAATFAGQILGIGNTISCLAGIICPMMVGWLTPNGTREEWQVVFWITAGVLMLGTTIFCVFASGEPQPWALSASKYQTDGENALELQSKKSSEKLDL